MHPLCFRKQESCLPCLLLYPQYLASLLVIELVDALISHSSINSMVGVGPRMDGNGEKATSPGHSFRNTEKEK